MLNELKNKLMDKSLMRFIEADVYPMFSQPIIREYVDGLRREIKENNNLSEDDKDLIMDSIELGEARLHRVF